MCSQLAALQAGQHSQDWEFPVIPRSIPAGRACGVSARLLSESHVAFSCLFSAWDPRCPHKTLPLGILHIPSALQAHQTMVINRRIQPLSTPHIKSETLYHGRILHLYLLSLCLQVKALHFASSKFFSQMPRSPCSSLLL